MARRHVIPTLASTMLIVLIFSVAWSVSPSAAEPGATHEIAREVSPAAAGLLKQINTASEQTLKGAVGLPEGIVAKIMAHRKSGGKFTDLIQLRSVTGMSSQELQRALAPFEQAEATKNFEAQRKPVPEPTQQGKAGGRVQRGTAAESDKASAPTSAEPAASGTGPITMVRPGFYGKLPGYEELDKIDPIKRTEFLETVNREMCTCGCKNETIAFCLVNDPTCPVVKSRAKKIYDDIMTKPAH